MANHVKDGTTDYGDLAYPKTNKKPVQVPSKEIPATHWNAANKGVDDHADWLRGDVTGEHWLGLKQLSSEPTELPENGALVKLDDEFYWGKSDATTLHLNRPHIDARDYTTLQAAIDAAVLAGRPLYLCQRTWTQDAALMLGATDHLVIFGDGIDRTTLQVQIDVNGGKGITGASGARLVLSHITYESVQGDGETGTLIYMTGGNNPSDLLVDHVAFKSDDNEIQAVTAIKMDGGPQVARVRNSTFRTNGINILVTDNNGGGGQLYAHGCTFETIDGDGVTPMTPYQHCLYVNRGASFHAEGCRFVATSPSGGYAVHAFGTQMTGGTISASSVDVDTITVTITAGGGDTVYPHWVGRQVTWAGATNEGNRGTFRITAVDAGAKTITFVNTFGPAVAADTGGTWSINGGDVARVVGSHFEQGCVFGVLPNASCPTQVIGSSFDVGTDCVGVRVSGRVDLAGCRFTGTGVFIDSNSGPSNGTSLKCSGVDFQHGGESFAILLQGDNCDWSFSRSVFNSTSTRAGIATMLQSGNSTSRFDDCDIQSAPTRTGGDTSFARIHDGKVYVNGTRVRQGANAYGFWLLGSTGAVDAYFYNNDMDSASAVVPQPDAANAVRVHAGRNRAGSSSWLNTSLAGSLTEYDLEFAGVNPSTIASAGTTYLSPHYAVEHVTGVATISTIGLVASGYVIASDWSGRKILVADGAFAISAAGNIVPVNGVARTLQVGESVVLDYDEPAGKWYEVGAWMRSAATPASTGTAAAGSGVLYSRDDHVHATGDATITPAKLAVEASALGTLAVIRKAFAAAGPGSPDDVTIYAANAPFAFRILDIQLLVLTNIGGSTVTLRDTSGGGGSALSDAFDSATTGRKRDAGQTASGQVAANGSLYLRRSDNGVAGEAVILIERV